MTRRQSASVVSSSGDLWSTPALSTSSSTGPEASLDLAERRVDAGLVA